MKTTTILSPTQNTGHEMWQRPMRISLVDIPGVQITTDRSETDPKSAPIRCADFNPKKDSVLRRAASVRQ